MSLVIEEQNDDDDNEDFLSSNNNNNNNNHFSEMQQAFLSTTPIIMSSISVLGNLWIIFEIWITSNKRYFVYHKLVSAMALYCLFSNIGYYLPSSSSSSSQEEGSNRITILCTAQGVLLQFQLGTALYFGMLGVYYMLVISYGISEERLVDDYYETFFHIIPILAVIGTSIAISLSSNGGFTSQDPLPWCWLDDGNSNSNNSNKVGQVWGFYLGPAWVSIAIFLLTLVMVFRVCTAQEQRMKRYLLTGNPGYGGRTTGGGGGGGERYNNTAADNSTGSSSYHDGYYGTTSTQGGDDTDGETQKAMYGSSSHVDVDSSNYSMSSSYRSNSQRMLHLQTSDMEEDGLNDSSSALLVVPAASSSPPGGTMAKTTAPPPHNTTGTTSHSIGGSSRASTIKSRRSSVISSTIKRGAKRISYSVQRRVSNVATYMQHLPRTRQVIGQALWYVMACSIPIVLTTIWYSGSRRFSIAALQVLIQPLQGFFIFIAYRRPTFLRYKRKGMTTVQAMKETINFDYGAFSNDSQYQSKPTHILLSARYKKRSSLASWFDSSETRRQYHREMKRQKRQRTKIERRSSHPPTKTDPSSLFATNAAAAAAMASTTGSSKNLLLDDDTTSGSNNNNHSENLLLSQSVKLRRHSAPNIVLTTTNANLIMGDDDDKDNGDDDASCSIDDGVYDEYENDLERQTLSTETRSSPFRQGSASTLRSSLTTQGSLQKLDIFKKAIADDSLDEKVIKHNKSYDEKNVDVQGEDFVPPAPLVSLNSGAGTPVIKNSKSFGRDRISSPPKNDPNNKSNGTSRAEDRRRFRRQKMMEMRKQSRQFLDLVCMDIIPQADDTAENQWQELMVGIMNSSQQGFKVDDDSDSRGVPSSNWRRNNNGDEAENNNAPRSPKLRISSNWNSLTKKVRANPLLQRSSRNLQVDCPSSNEDDGRLKMASLSPRPPPTIPAPSPLSYTQSDQIRLPPPPPASKKIPRARSDEVSSGSPFSIPAPLPLDHTQSDQIRLPPPPPASKKIPRARSDEVSSKSQQKTAPLMGVDFWGKLQEAKKRKERLEDIQKRQESPSAQKRQEEVESFAPVTVSARSPLSPFKQQKHSPGKLSRTDSARQIVRRELEKKRSELLQSINDQRWSQKQLRMEEGVENGEEQECESEKPPPPVDVGSPLGGQRKRLGEKAFSARALGEKQSSSRSFLSRFSNRSLGNIPESSENDDSFASLSNIRNRRDLLRYGNSEAFNSNDGADLQSTMSSNEISLLSSDSKKTVHRSNLKNTPTTTAAVASSIDSDSSSSSSMDVDRSGDHDNYPTDPWSRTVKQSNRKHVQAAQVPSNVGIKKKSLHQGVEVDMASHVRDHDAFQGYKNKSISLDSSDELLDDEEMVVFHRVDSESSA